MSNIVQKAKQGQRIALEQLYNSNLQKAYYIAYTLLGTEEYAKETIAYALKNVWGNIPSGEAYKEADFSKLFIKKIIEYSKKKILKHNSGAFQFPHNRQFPMRQFVNGNCRYGSFDEFAVNKLNDLQRIIFVMHTVCGFSKEELMKVTKYDMRKINLLLEVEESNIVKLAYESGAEYTYQEVIQMFIEREKSVEVPIGVKNMVADYIDSIAAPIEAKQKKKKIKITIVASVVIIIAVIAAIIFIPKGMNTTSTAIGEADAETDITVSDEISVENDNEVVADGEEITHYADIEIENYGTITVALNGNTAPQTVENFVKLANEGFYNGLTFHRIMDGFMMQGGDPNGDGTGGSDETVFGEFSDNGFDNPISHTRGTISMARSSEPDSGSSQFFIVHEDSTFLDGQYAGFGYVTEGMEIVDSICSGANPTDDNGTIPTDEQPIISSITIR